MRDEHTVRAYLEVVSHVVLFVRHQLRYESPISNRHVHDLMDAIHNVPTFLTEENHDWFTPEIMRELEFGQYDAKWSDQGGLHLVKMLDEALSREADN